MISHSKLLSRQTHVQKYLYYECLFLVFYLSLSPIHLHQEEKEGGVVDDKILIKMMMGESIILILADIYHTVGSFTVYKFEQSKS